LTPNGFGLRFDAGFRIQHGDRAVKNTQRAFDFDREVDVPRGIDDIDPVALPLCGGRSRSDGNSAFLFLSHPVHGRRAVVDLTDFVGLPGIKENTLRRRRFPGVDMSHNPYVASVRE
jgi:hypothetical protein